MPTCACNSIFFSAADAHPVCGDMHMSLQYVLHLGLSLRVVKCCTHHGVYSRQGIDEACSVEVGSFDGRVRQALRSVRSQIYTRRHLCTPRVTQFTPGMLHTSQSVDPPHQGSAPKLPFACSLQPLGQIMVFGV